MRLSTLALIVVSLAVVRPACGEVLYTITDLGTLGGTESRGSAINDGGHVAGYARNSAGDSRAFLYDGTTMTDLGTLGGVSSQGHGINGASHVVGYAKNSAGNNRAFLYDGTTMNDLGTLGGTTSIGRVINAADHVTGYAKNSAGDNRAFIYDGTTMRDLNDLIDSGLGWTLSLASDINNSGQITGNGTIGGNTHAYLLSAVPEPSTFAGLVGMGIVGLIGFWWRRRKAV